MISWEENSLLLPWEKGQEFDIGNKVPEGKELLLNGSVCKLGHKLCPFFQLFYIWQIKHLTFYDFKFYTS